MVNGGLDRNMTEIDYDQDDVKAGMLMRLEVYEDESKTTRSRPRPRAETKAEWYMAEARRD